MRLLHRYACQDLEIGRDKDDGIACVQLRVALRSDSACLGYCKQALLASGEGRLPL